MIKEERRGRRGKRRVARWRGDCGGGRRRGRRRRESGVHTTASPRQARRSRPPHPTHQTRHNSGLFIVAPDGTLRQKTVNDLPVGRSVDEVLRLVKAFQFTDEHGEVCPAGWTPGAATMKADPVGSLEYFSKVN